MNKDSSNYKPMPGFFDKPLADQDAAIFEAIGKELHRQQDQIELIASENIVSRAVMEAQGSVLTNKYAEGYPARRYYGGCEFVDIAEELAIERAKKLFNCKFANVQPHSGAQANQGVFITTSSFNSGAVAFAEQVPTRIVLIDGQRLTRLMIRYGVGVQVKRTVHLVEIDEDFFE